MKLWLLTRLPGKPSCDVLNGAVVRAEGEYEARMIASRAAGDEQPAAWLSPGLTTCEELLADGAAALLMKDFNAA